MEKHILLIMFDDGAESYKLLFPRSKFTIIPCIEMLPKERPDVVLLDDLYETPGDKGFAWVKTLSLIRVAYGEDVPIILLSCFHSDASIARQHKVQFFFLGGDRRRLINKVARIKKAK
jgi:hypothetical protein